MEARDRLALALDVDDLVEAMRLARLLRPWFGIAKVGLELFSMFAIFNVVRHCTPLHDLASVIAQRPGARLEPAIDAVRSAPKTHFIFQR